MAKVSYANLKLKTDDSVNTITFNNVAIEVKKYLPIESKYDLIMIAIQKATNSVGYVDPMLSDMYFHLNLIYLYTNLSFTELQKKDEWKIFDCLKCSGLLDTIIEAIPENEYNELVNTFNAVSTYNNEYNKTVVGAIKSFINEIPTTMENAAKIIDSFDKEKFAEVINFAQAANGGRPLQ